MVSILILLAQEMPGNKKYRNLNNIFQLFLQNPGSSGMFLESVEQFKEADIVIKLKPKMSCGHDEIPTKISL